MYVQSLRKMARIKSYFAIEREFDRYYELLKSQLRDGSDFTDVRDEEDLKIQVGRTFDKSKAWDNPNRAIPIEKAHLNMTKEDNPHYYEQLCAKHEVIRPIDETEKVSSQQLDPSMIEFLMEKPIEHWDSVSLQLLTQGLSNPETRNNLTMYLQSKPHKQEVRLIKELMLESLKQSRLPEVNPLQPTENFRRNISLVSLLTDNSGAHDVQLAYYAKVIEENNKSRGNDSFRTESSGNPDMAENGPFGKNDMGISLHEISPNPKKNLDQRLSSQSLVIPLLDSIREPSPSINFNRSPEDED